MAYNRTLRPGHQAVTTRDFRLLGDFGYVRSYAHTRLDYIFQLRPDFGLMMMRRHREQVERALGELARRSKVEGLLLYPGAWRILR